MLHWIGKKRSSFKIHLRWSCGSVSMEGLELMTFHAAARPWDVWDVLKHTSAYVFSERRVTCQLAQGLLPMFRSGNDKWYFSLMHSIEKSFLSEIAPKLWACHHAKSWMPFETKSNIHLLMSFNSSFTFFQVHFFQLSFFAIDWIGFFLYEDSYHDTRMNHWCCFDMFCVLQRFFFWDLCIIKFPSVFCF